MGFMMKNLESQVIKESLWQLEISLGGHSQSIEQSIGIVWARPWRGREFTWKRTEGRITWDFCTTVLTE